MANEKSPLDLLIEAAESGDADALAELSLVALGDENNTVARDAIYKIDAKPWPPVVQQTVLKSMIWPAEVESGNRGPRLGDVPIHNDL